MKIGVVALKEKLKESLDSAVDTTDMTEEKTETSEKICGSARNYRRIYVSQDTRPRTGTKPTTIDGKYVAEHLGSALTFALAELAEKRPKDPIEYLSKWLYKYRENMDHNMQVIQIKSSGNIHCILDLIFPFSAANLSGNFCLFYCYIYGNLCSFALYRD